MTKKAYTRLAASLDLDDLEIIRPLVEARMKNYQDAENEVAAISEKTMLAVIDRRIAALKGEMFYIVIDDTHRIELTPKGNYYPQHLVHDGAGDHFAYYHLALTRWNKSTQITRVQCNINQIHYRTECGAMTYILNKIVMEGTPANA